MSFFLASLIGVEFSDDLGVTFFHPHKKLGVKLGGLQYEDGPVKNSYFVKCGIASYCIILCYIYQYDSISYNIILYDTMLYYILIILFGR